MFCFSLNFDQFGCDKIPCIYELLVVFSFNLKIIQDVGSRKWEPASNISPVP